MRFTYVTVKFNDEGKTSLQIVRQTGTFEKKYKSTTVDFNTNKHYDNIELFKIDIINQVTIVLNSKRHFKWEKYDIHNLKYQHNISVFKGRTMVYSNIDESTMADILKSTLKDTQSVINLNSLGKYVLLISMDIIERENSYIADIKMYSENGNFYNNITATSNSPITVENVYEILDLDNIKLMSIEKKDIAIVSNACLITIKRED